MNNQRMSRGKYWIGMSCVFGSFLIILVILDMLSGTSPLYCANTLVACNTSDSI